MMMMIDATGHIDPGAGPSLMKARDQSRTLRAGGQAPRGSRAATRDHVEIDDDF
jgi:hypothetical protein